LRTSVSLKIGSTSETNKLWRYGLTDTDRDAAARWNCLSPSTPARLGGGPDPTPAEVATDISKEWHGVDAAGQAVNLTVPQSIIARADEVIE
jgi:hypothetical protein